MKEKLTELTAEELEGVSGGAQAAVLNLQTLQEEEIGGVDGCTSSVSCTSTASCISRRSRSL